MSIFRLSCRKFWAAIKSLSGSFATRNWQVALELFSAHLIKDFVDPWGIINKAVPFGAKTGDGGHCHSKRKSYVAGFYSKAVC
jgi:hypothetical protein